MSDPRDRSTEALESELRAWFKAAGTPVAPPSLRAALIQLGPGSTLLSPVRTAVEPPRPSAARWLAAVASALLVIVAAAGFLLVIGQHGPAGPTGSPGVVPSNSPTPGPLASQPTASPAVPTSIDDAGVFDTSGLWATRDSSLFLSTDRGATWEERPLVGGVALDATSGDVLSNVFVLDATHIWTASPGPGSTVPYGGQVPGFDHLHVVISRSDDGGVTWASMEIPGDWGGTQPVLSFADDQHGFLLLSGLRGGGGSVVFATTDGGATWQQVGGAPGLGSIFSASDAATLWAGNEGDAGPVARPILDVSRDGGRTWTDAALPGLVGDIFVNDNPVAPPVFSSQDGAVAVIAASTDNSPLVRFYRTSDGGRTWVLAAQVHIGEGGSTSVAAVDPLHYVVIDSQTGRLQATSDGGATWQPADSSGLGATLRLRFWDPLRGAAIVQIANGTAPAVGLLRTSDGGHTWSPVSITPPGPSPTEAASPPQVPSPGGTCSASQFVAGKATSDYGFGTLGTTVVFVTQPLRNDGPDCVLKLPETIGVASATGPFRMVGVVNAGTATSYPVKSGESLSIVLGGSWWVGVRPDNGTPLPAPPCAGPISDVSRVAFPFSSGNIQIDLDITWHEVCSSPASVSLTIKE